MLCMFRVVKSKKQTTTTNLQKHKEPKDNVTNMQSYL